MSPLWDQLRKRLRLRLKKKSALETFGHRIISDHQARALLQCIEYLSENISFFGLFLSTGSVDHCDKIYRKIESGDDKILDYLIKIFGPRECAMAVHRFIRSYKISILPERSLNLLCAQNEGIPRRLVALDALNLLRHDSSSGLRLQFAKAYLQMMQQLTLRGYLTPNEIRIIISPYLAVPTLFPGRNPMQNLAAKSAILMELFLSAHLLDDPESLSTELEQEMTRLQRRQRLRGQS